MPEMWDPVRGTVATDWPTLIEVAIPSFAAGWASILTPADGCPEAELAAAEARLGRPLPAVLRTGYGLFGRRDDLVRVQDRLLPPDELYVDEAALVFRTENQHVTRWALPAAALDRDDPPVVMWRDEKRDWAPFLDRLSWAALEMVLSEALMAESDRCDNRSLDEATVGALERSFTRLGLPDYPLWADRDGPPVRWFGSPDVVLRDDGRSWLWARARTPAALAALRRALPGDWLMTEPDGSAPT